MDWPSLLLARGWLRREAFAAADPMAQKAAVDLLTGGLTFPYTLASTGQRLCSAARPVRICVVGARAEASMPLHFWREALCLTGWPSLRLDMVGPKVDAAEPRGDMQQPSGGGGGGGGVAIVPEAALFHESRLHAELLGAPAHELPDAFVLFNPGLGEPGWGRAWEPTVRALVALRRPVLVTALSAADAAQDARFWARAAVPGGEGEPAGPPAPPHEYAPNPWASLLAAAVRGSDAPGASNSLVALAMTAPPPET